jgi:hypothetical protein
VGVVDVLSAVIAGVFHASFFEFRFFFHGKFLSVLSSDTREIQGDENALMVLPRYFQMDADCVSHVYQTVEADAPSHTNHFLEEGLTFMHPLQPAPFLSSNRKARV